MATKPRWLVRPGRGGIIPAAACVAAVPCAWVALERDLLAGVSLLAGLCGVFSLALILWPARPRLQMALRTPSGVAEAVTIGSSQLCRPLDLAEIVDERVQAALATLPAPPRTDAAGDPVERAGQALMASLFVSEESRQEFLGEVMEYERSLRVWLQRLDAARTERQRGFTGGARIFEQGEAPADHVRLRLRFPPGFDPPLDEDPIVGPPPERPQYELMPGLVARAFPSLNRVPPPKVVPPGVTYRRDGEATVVELELGRINQGDFVDSAEFSMRAAKPGDYVVEWEVSANGLRRPARGLLQLEVAEPTGAKAIQTLSEARTEQRRLSLT